MNIDIMDMLTYRRPSGSKTEMEFVREYIDTIPGILSDDFGNRILADPNSRVMIACHTDTVHKWSGRQRVIRRKGVAKLPRNSLSNCLGADDTAGVYAALRMIEAKVPVTYVFHRSEEIGGRGSRYLSDNHTKWIEMFDVCLSLDRRGTQDIITHQLCERTASDAFARSLARELGMDHRPAEGVFTDSAYYSYLIPECSNLSIGYWNEHTPMETLDLNYLELVIKQLIAVEWSKVAVCRDPSEWYWGTEDQVVQA